MTTSEELRIIARVHDRWAVETDPEVAPDPDIAKPVDIPSQYAEGKVDVSCSAAQEEDLQRRILFALRTAR